MTMVFDRYPTGGSERLLALAMADHARDDGTRIWPSLDELARKTLQSRSTVKRQVARMVSIGWLELVRDRTGRGNTNEYRICPAWIDGGLLPSQVPAEVVTGADEVIHNRSNLNFFPETVKGFIHDIKGFIHDRKGFTAMNPESSEPLEPNTPLPPDGGADGFERIAGAYPNKANREKARRRWLRIAPGSAVQAQMLAAIDAQRRTPKWQRDKGQFVPELATWLRNACWRDEVAVHVAPDWWTSTDGVKAMGQQLGMPFSLAPLGNAYTDDQHTAHWRRYRSAVLLAAGNGPWSERRTA